MHESCIFQRPLRAVMPAPLGRFLARLVSYFSAKASRRLIFIWFETVNCHLDQVGERGGGVGKVQEGFFGQRGHQVRMVVCSCIPKTSILEVVHFYRQLSTSPCLRGPEFLNTADEAVKDIPRWSGILRIYPGYQEAQRTSSFNDYKMVNEAIFSSSGSKLLVGGFGLCGIPENLIGGLVKSGAKWATKSCLFLLSHLQSLVKWD